MALFKSKQVADRLPIPSANAATDLIPIMGEWTVPAGLVTGDIVEMAPLPAGYVLTDALLDHQALGAAFTGALGVMSGNFGDGGARTCDASIIAAATRQADGVARLNVPGATRIAPTTNDRSVGLVISGTLTSPVVGAKARVTLFVRPMVEGA